MTIETDLQAVINATTTLNSTVQNLTNSVWAATNAAVADSQSRTTTAINNLSSSVQAELNLLRPMATDFVSWTVLGTRQQIFPAGIIGNGWADGGYGSNQTITYNGQTYTIFGAADATDSNNGGNQRQWSNEYGTYIPSPAKNPWYEWGAADSYGTSAGNATERLAGSGAHGAGIGSAYAPVLRKKSDYSLITFTNAQSQTDYYRCYWDIDLTAYPIQDRLQANPAANSLNNGRTLYLVMSGSITNHPDQLARTWCSVTLNHVGSYNGTWGFNVFDTDGNGSVDVITSNFSRPHVAVPWSSGADAGVPQTGDAGYTCATVAVEGTHYGGGAITSFTTGYNKNYELNPDFVPTPNTTTGTNQYQNMWLIPIGTSRLNMSSTYLRVYNWGYATMVIEAWGFAYGPKIQY